jgi:hypothetical protein
MAGSAAFWAYYLPLNLGVLAGFAVIAWSRHKWAHWIAFALLFGVAQYGFSVWDIVGASAVVEAPKSN